MNTHIILLRGVNVGGNHLLPMKELKILLELAGFKHVKTYIQSGNIILSGFEDIERSVNEIIQTNFGFAPEVMVMSEKEFDQAFSNNPYKEYEGKYVHFFFCKETPIINEDKLIKLSSPTERYELLGNVFYLHAPEGIGRSKLAEKIETCLGVRATARNLNTVNKIHEMLKNA